MEVRLNSSRGKFEITTMADNQVDLTPEEFLVLALVQSRNRSAVSTTSLLKNGGCRHMFSQGQEPACKQ